MSEKILNTEDLPEALSKLISTEKVKIRETNGENRLIPIQDIDYINKLRGSLANYPQMSVDKFLERKHADNNRPVRKLVSSLIVC
ncbi:MAG: hypothetical protein LBC12_02705 [Nitrososphaerota archaeon]|jgi:hypothetical protein|nr:hypothetical protein [Nitrososphaerota archaeon]